MCVVCFLFIYDGYTIDSAKQSPTSRFSLPSWMRRTCNKVNVPRHNTGCYQVIINNVEWIIFVDDTGFEKVHVSLKFRHFPLFTWRKHAVYSCIPDARFHAVLQEGRAVYYEIPYFYISSSLPFTMSQDDCQNGGRNSWIRHNDIINEESQF